VAVKLSASLLPIAAIGCRRDCVTTTHSRCSVRTRAWLDYEPIFRGKIDALGQNSTKSGPKCQGRDGITAYVVRPHAPDGAPTVGAARKHPKTPSLKRRKHPKTLYKYPVCDGFLAEAAMHVHAPQCHYQCR
jgi:hypothetical protein